MLVIGELSALSGVQRPQRRLSERWAVLLRTPVHDELPEHQVDLGPVQVQDTQ